LRETQTPSHRSTELEMRHLDSGIPRIPYVCPSWHCQEGQVKYRKGRVSPTTPLSFVLYSLLHLGPVYVRNNHLSERFKTFSRES